MSNIEQYVKELEAILLKEGYKKICNYCQLACMPIWSKTNEQKDHCELCDEFEQNDNSVGC